MGKHTVRTIAFAPVVPCHRMLLRGFTPHVIRVSAYAYYAQLTVVHLGQYGQFGEGFHARSASLSPKVQQDKRALQFGKRVFATPKKMGAETAEANVNAGLAAAHQIVNYFEIGCVKYQVNK